MEPSFWRDRWREGKIGFHEGRPNRFLAEHVDRLGTGRRVLVPLCGKAEDLAFLAARGHAVVGVELVEDAVRAFFAEHAIEPAVQRTGKHAIYTAGTLALIVGDFFAVTRELIGGVDALYDRAALIALPPDTRPRYVAHVRALVPAGSPGLVITLDYPPAEMAPPPFALGDSEVRTLYGPAIELLGEADEPQLRARGPSWCTERCYSVTL